MHPHEHRAAARVLAVADLVYEAALDPGRWTDALVGMRELVAGAAVSLRVESFEPASLQQIWIGFEPAFQKAYFEHYWQEDVCGSVWPLGRTGTADTVVPVAVRKRAPFFNELCVPFQLDDLVGGLVESTPTRTIALSVMRPRGRRPFDESHTALLDAVLPHIRRAVRINTALESAGAERAFARDMIDRLPFGLFAIDARCRVRHVNRAGEAMLGNGLRAGRAGLVAERPTATRDLRLALAAARSPHAEHVPAPIAVSLPRTGAAPLTAVAMPASQAAPHGLPTTRGDVLLVVTDPRTLVEPSAALLVRAYGLTATEARVAILLGRGLAPKEVARELGTAWNTVRYQLRQVYAKTGTSGQSALGRLLVLLGVIRGS